MSTEEDQRTCGQGLAEHSVLPSKLSELMLRAAEVLEVHTLALDLADANAKKEYAAYVELVQRHRIIADGLRALAERMAFHRSLPPAKHDPARMVSPPPLAAFELYVKSERDLAAFLEHRLERDQKMLIEMVTLAPEQP